MYLCAFVQQTKSFILERIFDSRSNNLAVYKQSTSSLIDKLYEGYNCCVIAYGPETAGKENTLYGDKDSAGIIANVS